MQELDRLAPQLAVEGAPVGLGQLAGAVVQLGVADLGVLGVARGLEVGALGGARGRVTAGYAAKVGREVRIPA